MRGGFSQSTRGAFNEQPFHEGAFSQSTRGGVQ